MDFENNIKIKIGARIKLLRTEIGLTQEQLADKLPNLKGKSSIANYENGSNLPSDEVKLKMCELFNCSLDYLMCNSDIRNIESITIDMDETEVACSNGIRGLNETNKMIVKNTIEALRLKQEKDEEGEK